MIKWLKRATLAIIATPMLGLIAWYLFGFLPYLGMIREVQDLGKAELVGIESNLYPLAVIADGKDGMRNYVMKTAYSSMALKGSKQKMLFWHLNTALWNVVSYVHFDDREIFYLWSIYAPYGKGRGLSNASEYYFGKKLNELSLREQTTILAIPKAPSLYKFGSEKLKERVDAILNKETHNQRFNIDAAKKRGAS